MRQNRIHFLDPLDRHRARGVEMPRADRTMDRTGTLGGHEGEQQRRKNAEP